MTPWYLLQSGPGAAPENMAVDETLLEAAVRLGRPVLRFYSWTEPAASFGYFQRHAEVERQTHLRPLVRRPTAGGIVPHDADWTYSVIIPPGDAWYELSATEGYQRAHQWQQRAFARLNVPTELAPCCRRELPGQCFAGYEQFDLLWHGRKIAGAAQRRNRHGLLIQGSVQPPPGPAKVDWQKALCDTGHFDYEFRWEELEPDTALRDRVEELARDKYSQAAWNRKR